MLFSYLNVDKKTELRYRRVKAISAYFFGRENQINPREKFSIFGRENELRPWKNRKNPSKVGVKITFSPWKFWQITRVKTTF